MKRKKLDTAANELAQAIALLVRRVRATTAARQLSLSESSVLSRLAEGGPSTTADLARAEAVKPQSMGAMLAALESLELIERRPDDSDGRRVNVRLTHKGEAYRKSIKDAKRSWLAQTIEKWMNANRKYCSRRPRSSTAWQILIRSNSREDGLTIALASI